MSILPQPTMRSLKRVWASLLDAVLPGHCLLCGSDTTGDLLCPDCHCDLPPPPLRRCPQCAEATTFGERCGACLKDPPHFDRTFPLWRYDFPVDRLIHALKYGHQLVIADWLGVRMAQQIGTTVVDLIVALPLHPEKLRQRGFNQSMAIAAKLGNCLNLPVDRQNLIRVRATVPQADLPFKERQRNVRGAFEAKTSFAGKHLLLIDDVMTTGATLNECARVLKIHGAREVSVAIAARAIRRY